MTNNGILKKKILYRSSHRGTKEMDMLMGNLVNKYIDLFNSNELNDLDYLLNLDDEILYKWYYDQNINLSISKDDLLKKLKNLKRDASGGEGGIRTHE